MESMTINERLLMRYAKTMKCARKECREKFELTHPKRKYCSERCRKKVEKQRWRTTPGAKVSYAKYARSVKGKAVRRDWKKRQLTKTQHP